MDAYKKIKETACTLTLLWGILILVPALAVGQTSIEKLSPGEYFDFWVGKWQVSWEEADGRKGEGINVVTKTLDGKVIQENFEVRKGDMKGFKGTSISVYQERKKQWKQAWADNSGGYFDFTGRFNGNKRIFQTQPVKAADGEVFVQRMIFYDITSNSLTWDWESSRDGGENWTLNWRIKYRRMD